MGSNTFRSAVYNTSDKNKKAYDKITSCSDKSVLNKPNDLNNEQKKTLNRSNVNFKDKRGFYFV